MVNRSTLPSLFNLSIRESNTAVKDEQICGVKRKYSSDANNSWAKIVYPYRDEKQDITSPISEEKLKSFSVGADISGKHLVKLVDIYITKDKNHFVFRMRYEISKTDNTIKLVGISVRGERERWNREIDCVWIEVSEERKNMNIDLLFYELNNYERGTCRINQLSKDKQGEGRIIIEALISMAASLRFDTITLSDSTTHSDPRKSPYFGDNMAGYLRLVRGYGFYEGLGFFRTSSQDDSIAKTRQETFIYTVNEFYTTPLKHLDLGKESKYGGEIVDIIKPVIDYISKTPENRFMMNLSFRGIVKNFEGQIQHLRPSQEEVLNTFDIVNMRIKWREKVNALIQKPENRDTKKMYLLVAKDIIDATNKADDILLHGDTLVRDLVLTKHIYYRDVPYTNSTEAFHLICGPSESKDDLKPVVKEAVCSEHGYNLKVEVLV